MAKDYDKLAQEIGGVDYDVLAQALGGNAATEDPGAIPEPSLTPLQQSVESYGKFLPAVGGAVGGLALGLPGTVFGMGVGGVPSAVAGAGLGGAGGAAAEDLIRRAVGLPASESSAEAALGVGRGAAEQVASELTGRGVGKAVGALAKPLMAKALRPAVGVVRNFPEVVALALKRKATINAWRGRGGIEAADKVRREATGHVVGLLRKATRRGAAIDIESVAEPVVKAVEKKAGSLAPIERQQLLDMVQQRADQILLQSVMGATQRSSKLMSPFMADELRFAANRLAKSTLAQEAAGLPTTAIPDMDRLIAKGAADAIKKLPGLKAARAAQREAIGVSRAVRAAQERPAPADVAVGLGPIHAGFGLPPGAASRLALAADAFNNPAVGAILANMLRFPYAGVSR